MPTVKVYNMAGEVTGEIELSEAVFGIEPNEQALHATVKNHLANKRQGTQSALTRAEVSGGGIKPYRQKGTGRARQGSIRAPHYTHGGVAFAPKPRDYSYSVPKKVKRLALKSALSSKVKENEIIVIDSLEFSEPKTKEMIKVLENVKAAKKALIVTAEKNENVVRSAANIPGVKTSIVSAMNTYEIVNATSFIVTKDAVEKIQEVYS